MGGYLSAERGVETENPCTQYNTVVGRSVGTAVIDISLTAKMLDNISALARSKNPCVHAKIRNTQFALVIWWN